MNITMSQGQVEQLDGQVSILWGYHASVAGIQTKHDHSNVVQYRFLVPLNYELWLKSRSIVKQRESIVRSSTLGELAIASSPSKLYQEYLNERKVRSTALSKAVSSIPTCGYVDRRDKIDHHVREYGSRRMKRNGNHTSSLGRHSLTVIQVS